MAKAKPKKSSKKTKKKEVMSAKDFVDSKVVDFKNNLADEIKAFYQQTGFYVTEIEILKEVENDLTTLKGVNVGSISIG
jgi:hypothetical protein